MKVLILGNVFPKGHPKQGIRTAFGSKVLSGEKLHTIRENARGFYVDGDWVSVRRWTGVAYRSKQVELVRVRTGLEQVRILRTCSGVWVYVNGERVDPTEVARNDGLSLGDFVNWFFPAERFGEFKGDLIHLSDFRYTVGAGVLNRG